MQSVVKQEDVHLNSEAFNEWVERFEIWIVIRKDVEDDKIVASFLTFIGKEA